LSQQVADHTPCPHLHNTWPPVRRRDAILGVRGKATRVAKTPTRLFVVGSIRRIDRRYQAIWHNLARKKVAGLSGQLAEFLPNRQKKYLESPAAFSPLNRVGFP
jgi:hypothetical protein